MTRHGTRFGYRDDKCKCDPCKKAIALEHNIYRMRRTANNGQPLTVTKTGAVRRLQALMALGWPRRELARQAGYKGDTFALILNGRRQRITLETHRRIDDLYENLCMTLGPSSSSRIRAAKKGFLPPLAWENIDDPDERPNLTDDRSRDDIDEAVIERVLAGDKIPTTFAERVEITRRWEARGRSLNELERSFGWKSDRYTIREQAAS